MRVLVHWAVGLLIAAAVSETLLVQGVVVPCRVESGSMAGAILGIHRDVVCADCGYRFSCGADGPHAPARAVCPNCGYAANRLDGLPDLSGQRVWIDRRAFSLRRPRRWEVVAIRRPQQASQILVKRIIGLPGESVEIRDGDVYVDGQIQRKSLAQQHALAVPVYDAAFQPTLQPMPPPRWRPQGGESHWSLVDGRFTHPAGTDGGPLDWLVYHHWRRVSAIDASPTLLLAKPNQANSSAHDGPITDVCGYNQSQPCREENSHAVADLLLSFRLEAAGAGTFYVCAADGGDQFEVRLAIPRNSTGQWRYQVFRAGKPIPGIKGEIRPVRHPLIEVSLIDQQFSLALDGQTVVAWPYMRTGRPSASSSTPLAIGVRGPSVTVHSLQVYRDVYYFDASRPPIGSTVARLVRLRADQYFVLGDNSPISEDSRNWDGPATVDANLLIGKVLAANPRPVGPP